MKDEAADAMDDLGSESMLLALLGYDDVSSSSLTVPNPSIFPRINGDSSSLVELARSSESGSTGSDNGVARSPKIDKSNILGRSSSPRSPTVESASSTSCCEPA